ncbi:unnamed protein product [Adineta ricciae]|uniref:CCHC-type domain-containing protein n=2 Tax=Adineta ricciae TaxID=249248 RepID=A0A815U860_ADIRI|nr:unnamed protein product [Adineta ricciae]
MYNTASSITRIPPTTHTIVIPPRSAIPTVSGNSTENPRQFLIRVQEYTETINHWDNQSLLNGISQFLRRAALEWYCQLRISHRRPQTWIEFTNLFLNQFNSPVRRARQEQLWKECRQEENETINEFLVRLQALWQEQKPNENEDDLVRHLMCKMKNSLLSMIGISRCESLDGIIMEAQKIEEILYQRSKQHRDTHKKELIEQMITTENYNCNDPCEIQAMSAYQSRKQPNTYRQQNHATTYNQNNQQSSQYKHFSSRPTSNYRYMQSKNEIVCYACGMKGHLKRNCPGASLTLINSQFFKKLPIYYQRRARPPPPHICLQLVDRSHLQVKSSLTLPSTISNSTRRHTVYVVPQLWRSCIIGNDLIRKHNLQIDGGRQYAYSKKYNRNKPPRQTEKENIPNDEEYTLLSIERIKLPPFHAYHIRVKPNKMFKSSNETNDEAEYEITSIKETPRVANGIITPQHDMIIQLANLTERMIMIHTNQPLAKMTRLNQNQLNMIQYGQSNTANISTELSPEETTNLINTDLNEDQKIKLKQLIKKFPAVFNEQAGRTTKLQHHINLTPGSQPYNSPPYRYAPAR